MPDQHSSVVRIGAGAGFAGDRLEPAIALAEQARLDALIFECLAERTIALAHQARLAGTSPGFDPLLTERIRSTLPAAHRNGTTLISNGGAANPVAGAEAVLQLAADLGFRGVRVAALTGDDVLHSLDLRQARILNSDDTLWGIRDRIVSANAYLGVSGLLEALDDQPAVIVTGRTADASLFLAPLMHLFGWKPNDLNVLAGGTLIGHLLECAGQITGGYFADGERKYVPGLARLGFPFAEVKPDASALIKKLPGTGGRIDRMTCLEQMLYEVDDPHAYLTPDVILDMSGVAVEELDEPNTVVVGGAVGRPAPETLKVSVGVRDGFVGVAEISYAGHGCLHRANMAADIVAERWTDLHRFGHIQITRRIIGLNSCRPWYQPPDTKPLEVRLRLSVRDLDQAPAVTLVREVEALYTNGPAGGGGVTSRIESTVGIVSTTIPRAETQQSVTMLQ